VAVRSECFQQHPDFFRVYVAEIVAAGGDVAGIAPGIHKDITLLTDLIWSGLKPA
jgi:hypothetical protein